MQPDRFSFENDICNWFCFEEEKSVIPVLKSTTNLRLGNQKQKQKMKMPKMSPFPGLDPVLEMRNS
jgi:hypothetical protein